MRRALLLALLLAACAQPPTREVSLAEARVMKAREAGAPVYAADLLNEAESALRRARESLSRPEHYRRALRAAALASLVADEARGRAVAEKARVSRRAERFLLEDEALLDEARSLGAQGFAGSDLDSYTMRLKSLQSLLEAGKEREAFEGGKALKGELLGFLQKLERLPRRKPSRDPPTKKQFAFVALQVPAGTLTNSTLGTAVILP